MSDDTHDDEWTYVACGVLRTLRGFTFISIGTMFILISIAAVHGLLGKVGFWVLFGIVAILGGVYMIRKGAATGRRLRDLHRLRNGLCLECGYDLHGLTEARCPECNTAFDPDRLPEPSP